MKHKKLEEKMQASSRIQAVIEILKKMELAKQPMDNVVGDYMRGKRYIGSSDRSHITGLIYDMARAKAKIEWWIAKYKVEDNARNRVITALVFLEELEVKQIQELFDGDKYGPFKMDHNEKEFLGTLFGQEFEHKDMPLAVRCECPPEHEETLKKLWGDDFENEMMAMLEQATLDFRVNVGMLDRDGAIASLGKDKIKVEKTPYSPWGLRAQKKIFISQTRAFKKGHIDIQDEGSQLISYVCNAQPGMQVLDYCAGGGGKTLGLAGSTKGKGRIVAMDIDARRLDKAKPRLKRAWACDNVELRPLSEERNRKWLRRQKGTFDVTLIDVPCSGAGTWRRNPDMRWDNYGPKFEDLLSVQAEILDKVAHTVKVGGRLVYATCSLLPEENEKQIEAFLARNPSYKLLPLKEAWPKDEETKCPCDADYMRLTPYQHNTDGFFAAVLERIEAKEN